MTPDHSPEAITRAREIVLAWVCRQKSGDSSTNEELAERFCALLPTDVELELKTSRNPSAMVYEARWYHQGREVPDFPKPFCADNERDARILACAAMVELPG
ncbi:MAG: hypothetical protein P4L99_13000 [Chthoniobacter sp.]|nr:hypothetical protein [Chthoniobacter sp.]